MRKKADRMAQSHSVFLSLRNRPPRPIGAPERAVLCLGNFDGVHVAHRALLRAGVRSARADGCLCGVFCFYRPSSDYFPAAPAPDAVGGGGNHLCSLSGKLALFAAEGIDFVWLCSFPAVREIPAQDFPDYLRRGCGCRGIVCGFNYRYGSGGAGTAASLAAAFSRPSDLPPAVLPEMRLEDGTVSSSRIRAALRDGSPRLAAALLGRPYSLEGCVVAGRHLGHSLGFPTANLYFPAGRLIPAHGVYAVRVHTPDGSFPGVSNVGVRPTVDGSANPRPNCETYCIGFSGDLYGRTVRVEFLEYLRHEQKFSGLDALRAAIARDAERAAELVLPE